MTDNHPITPPPELLEQWCHKWTTANGDFGPYLATQAAQYGADQQLEQCVAWLDGYEHEGWAAEMMRNACRPKPPSLAEEALAELEVLSNYAHDLLSNYAHDLGCSESVIRRALERLQELEGAQ